MTASGDSNTPSGAQFGDARRASGGVLDPRWEDELRAGQEAEGQAGSVEAELAIVRLLRHAAAPEVLSTNDLQRVWDEVETEIEAAQPVPWYRRGWARLLGSAAAAAAAATVVVVLWPDPVDDAQSTGLAEPDAVASAQGAAQLLEAQFEMLAPQARAELDAAIETDRSSLRADLIEQAVATGKSMGGAP